METMKSEPMTLEEILQVLDSLQDVLDSLGNNSPDVLEQLKDFNRVYPTCSPSKPKPRWELHFWAMAKGLHL